MGVASPDSIALRALTEWLRARFGARLVDLRLFGSRARGEAHEDSDVDVLVVVEAITAEEAREVTNRTGDLLTEHSVLLSPFVLSAEHWARLCERGRGIAEEIARDGVPL